MTWAYEAMRSLGQLCYWRNYRYARPRGGTALTYTNDVADFQPVLKSDDVDEYEGCTWHERWYAGYHECRTGRYVFTKPQPDRLAAALAYIKNAGVVTAVALAAHAGDLEEACRYAG